MKILVKGKAAIDTTKESAAEVEALKTALSLRNPDYEKAIRRNPRARFALSPYTSYYEEKEGVMFFPRGAVDYLPELASSSVDYKLVESRSRVKTKIKLRDYQEGIAEGIVEAGDNGVIKLYTGFGKTIIALKLAEMLGQRTLIIVKDKKGFNQFVKDIEHFVHPDAVGKIKGKTVEIGQITVATIQTLQRDTAKIRSDYRNKFGLVIVDECHEFVTDKRRETISAFAPKYLYGMTATDRRTDGQGEAIFFMFGKKLIERNLDVTPPRIEVLEYRNPSMVGEYHEMVAEMIDDEERNELITRAAEEDVKEGRKILILTKRIDHFMTISEMLKEKGVKAVHPVRSDAPEKAQADLMQALRKNKIDYDVILGTYSMLSTGVDVPSLDTLYLAGDIKSDVLIEQSAGRILRLFEGKDDPKVVDVQDTGNAIFKRQAKSRMNFYSDQGWLITHRDYEL